MVAAISFFVLPRNFLQSHGGEIVTFYVQLKFVVDKGWILKPEPAQMRQVETS